MDSGGRRPRFLCLHGFRTSGAIMRKQVLGKWPDRVTSRLDLVFPDGPLPATGKSDVEGVFDPPYYEWYQVNEGEYKNLDEAIGYIEELMIAYGPFDGLMGFSQGLALTRVPRVKYVIIIGGSKFRAPTLNEKCYAAKIACPSLHFIGDNDFLKKGGEELLEVFVDPVVIRHPKGHTVPRIDERSLQIMLNFLEMMEKDMS